MALENEIPDLDQTVGQFKEKDTLIKTIAALTKENEKLKEENHELRCDRKIMVEDLVGLRNRIIKIVDPRVHVDNKLHQKIQGSH